MKYRYVFTDVHGCRKLFDKIVRYIDDEGAIFLGDACDRGGTGEDSYYIMNYMLDRPEQFMYLKGNHEDMMVQAMRYVPQVGDWRNLRNTWINNGGGALLNYLKNMPKEEQNSFITRIDNLPISYSQNEFDFCHAGGTMGQWQKQNISDIATAELIWSRDHGYLDWFDNRILIHGHTPTTYLHGIKLEIPEDFDTDEMTPIWYCNHQKLDLDVGAFYTHRIYLYDLVTRKMILFRENDIYESMGT